MAEPRASRASEELARLVTDLCPALFAWARLRMPPALRPVLPVEDVVQDVWLRVLRLCAEGNGPATGSPRAWVFAVAKLVLLEAERAAWDRARRGDAPGGSEWQRAVADLPHEVTSLTQRLARDEGVRAFLERVAGLDEDDRQLLVYCGLEEVPQHEAARRLGLSDAATQKRWQRLRETVRGWGAAHTFLAG